MRRQAAVCVAIGVLLACGTASSLELSIAALAYQDETGSSFSVPVRPEVDLLRALSVRTSPDIIILSPARNAVDGPVRTFLDAARLCETQGYRFLLYGFVRKSEYSFYAEVKLLESEKRDVVAVFFNSDDAAHYDRFVGDLADRIASFFHEEIGLKPPVRKSPPRRNLLEVPMALGYWTPVGGDWSQVLAGLGSVNLGIRFIPASPLFVFLSSEWTIALGCDVEYDLGMSQPSYEGGVLHAVQLRLPIELFTQLSAGHSLGMGIGPLLRIDTLVQDRKYDDFYTATTAVGGLSVSVTYRYLVSDSLSLGMTAIVDVAFYNTPLSSFSPRIFIDWTPGHGSGR